MRSQYTLAFKLIYSQFPTEGDPGRRCGAEIPEDLMQLSRSLPVTADYPLHISSFNRKAFLAFPKPTPCFIFILPPLLSSFSLHLSIPPPCGKLGPPIFPQATVNVWHGGTGSQSPQKPAVSMRDAHSEIIRSFISVREHGSVCDLLRQVFL